MQNSDKNAPAPYGRMITSASLQQKGSGGAQVRSGGGERLRPPTSSGPSLSYLTNTTTMLSNAAAVAASPSRMIGSAASQAIYNRALSTTATMMTATPANKPRALTTTAHNPNQQPQPPYRVTAYTPQERIKARTAAREEANAVCDTPEYASGYMDSFNLLSVVTNPRSGAPTSLLTNATMHGSTSSSAQSGSSSATTKPAPTPAHAPHSTTAAATTPTQTPPTSSPQQPQPSQTSTNATTSEPSADPPSSSEETSAGVPTFSELTSLDLSTLDNTLVGVTGAIDSINSVVDQFTNEFINPIIYASADDEGLAEYEAELRYEDIPTLQLTELPMELRDLDLGTVEDYLRKCGTLAHRFGIFHGESGPVEAVDASGFGRLTMGAATAEPGGEADKSGEAAAASSRNEAEEEATSQVPAIFFSPYFDLTDPKTFESLLVVNDDEPPNEESSAANSKLEGKDSSSASDSPEEPSKPIMSIQPPEALTAHLDSIELALLNQVRSKSGEFFRETNRFSYLKSVVSQSVSEVRALQSDLSAIRDRTVADVELVPVLDKKREDLRSLGLVLDEISDVLEVKGSVAGLISARDYIGAVEAIHSARQLLNGSPKRMDHAEDVDMNGSMDHEDIAPRFALSRLSALSKVNDQLAEYENLVVMDLSTDLIELFLNWGSSSAVNGTTDSTFVHSSPSFGSPSIGVVPIAARNKVKEIVRALRLCRQLSSTVDKYREKLSDMVRVTVRTTVTECAADAVPLATVPKGSSQQNTPLSKKGSRGAKSGDSLGDPGSAGSGTSLTAGVTSMAFEQFMSCLDMLFEQLLGLLRSAVGVNKFCREEGISLRDDGAESSGEADVSDAGRKTADAAATTTTSSMQVTSTPSALAAASDLSHKSVSELLRLRKEAHSLVTFDEMKRLWDTCLSFTVQLEKFSGQKAYGLRSTLLAQAKAFIERKHEGNMASLVAALDGERWTQCDVSMERQVALTRLCSGRAVTSLNLTTQRNSVVNGTLSEDVASTAREKLENAEVEGKHYRVVWSCLLLVEMVMGNVSCAAHFQTLATNVVGKVADLLRLFNSRTTHLVLGAGAIHSAARLKSINAKHLALVTQCIGLVLAILPHVRAALMAQLPSKQHTLLVDLDKIKKDYEEHKEKVLAKFVSIIGGIVEHGLASRIGKTDFDSRARSQSESDVACCAFLDGISSNTNKMHQVLGSLLPPDDLKDVFSRIFAYVDHKVPSLFISAASDTSTAAQGAASSGPSFSFPKTEEGKRRMLLEMKVTTDSLNQLEGVRPWDFSAVHVLERHLEIPKEDVATATVMDEKKDPEDTGKLPDNEDGRNVVVVDDQDDDNKNEEDSISVTTNGNEDVSPSLTLNDDITTNATTKEGEGGEEASTSVNPPTDPAANSSAQVLS